MKKGDLIEITEDGNLSQGMFFKCGDTATLERIDKDGDWWATFSDGSNWCVGQGPEDERLGSYKFKVIEEA